MIKTVAEVVEALGAGHKVDLGNPDRTIVIEVNKVFLLPIYAGWQLICRIHSAYLYCKITNSLERFVQTHCTCQGL